MHVVPEAVQDSPLKISSAKFTGAHRLLRKEGFDRVVRAESITSKYFKVFFARNGRENARLGIVSSKKILVKAVDRNFAKRLIRETFRRHRIILSKTDVVVMLRPAYAQEASMLKNELAELLSNVENKCTE